MLRITTDKENANKKSWWGFTSFWMIGYQNTNYTHDNQIMLARMWAKSFLNLLLVGL